MRTTARESIVRQPAIKPASQAGQLRIFVGTFNMGQASAKKDPSFAQHWIPDSALDGLDRADIIAIGVQERKVGRFTNKLCMRMISVV